MDWSREPMQALVKQTIKELQDIVHCDCAPDYLDRGLHSHVCLHYMAEPVKLVANRIEELEGKLEKAVEALEPFSEMAGEMFARNWNDDGVAISLVTKQGAMRLTFKEFRRTRATLAELTGGNDE